MDDDATQFYYTSLPINSFSLPESFTLNQVYRIDVTYSLPDTCTTYERFNVLVQDTTVRNVFVTGVRITDLVSCTQAVTQEQASFNFMVKYDQPYTFRFFKGEDIDGEPEFLEVTVPVN